MPETISWDKKRRSERIPAVRRLLLQVLGPGGAEVLKDIVTTVEISQHGAHIRGRRFFKPDWMGVLVQLHPCRKAPFRVAWQVKSKSHQGYFDTGVELLVPQDFWDHSFSGFAVRPEPAEDIENAALSSAELLRELKKTYLRPGGETALEMLWGGLVEQLEQRHIFTRAELVSTLRKIGI